MLSLLNKFLLFFIIFSLTPSFGNGYRILGLFPFPGVSHFKYFHPVMRELADAGHDVTVLSYFPDKDAPSNYKDIVFDGMEVMTNSINFNVSPFHFMLMLPLC